MPNRHTELSRFSASGKTFFFNKGHASTGTDYLGVNALYGQGNQERLVIFPSQMLDFYKHYVDAMGEITGVVPLGAGQVTQEAKKTAMSGQCPGCGAGWSQYKVTVEEPDWVVTCGECDHLLFISNEDAFEVKTNGHS